jgi:hypothetical protein
VDHIASPLPVRDLPIAMAPAVVLLGRDRYGIVVPFEAGKDVADDAQVSYTVAALDAAGKVVGQTNGRAKAKGGRISAVARLAVRGSTLQIRVAATAEGSEARGLAFATARVPDGPSTLPWCGGFALEQAGAAPALREFSANRLLTMTVIVSADTLDGAPLAFALGAPGRPAERSFPIEAGRALSRGVWQFSLELKPPLPRGWVDVVLHRDGAPLGEGCKTAFRLE